VSADDDVSAQPKLRPPVNSTQHTWSRLNLDVHSSSTSERLYCSTSTVELTVRSVDRNNSRSKFARTARNSHFLCGTRMIRGKNTTRTKPVAVQLPAKHYTGKLMTSELSSQVRTLRRPASSANRCRSSKPGAKRQPRSKYTRTPKNN